jgi:hypothetical protein
MDYYLDAEVLYKRSSDGTLLRYLNGTEAKKKLMKGFMELMVVDI